MKRHGGRESARSALESENEALPAFGMTYFTSDGWVCICPWSRRLGIWVGELAIVVELGYAMARPICPPLSAARHRRAARRRKQRLLPACPQGHLIARGFGERPRARDGWPTAPSTAVIAAGLAQVFVLPVGDDVVILDAGQKPPSRREESRPIETFGCADGEGARPGPGQAAQATRKRLTACFAAELWVCTRSSSQPVHHAKTTVRTRIRTFQAGQAIAQTWGGASCNRRCWEPPNGVQGAMSFPYAAAWRHRWLRGSDLASTQFSTRRYRFHLGHEATFISTGNGA